MDTNLTVYRVYFADGQQLKVAAETEQEAVNKAYEVIQGVEHCGIEPED